MIIKFSLRRAALASAAVTALALTACAAQNGMSRYGDCTEPCMPTYQPAYMESYYQVPVAPLPAPAPAPMPAPLPMPAPPVKVSPPPAISCPGHTIIQTDGTCLQLEAPKYIPPVIGYTPDPVAPPKIYTPIRK